MITTMVKIIRLFPVNSPLAPNFFSALIFIKVSEHPEGGDQISSKTSSYHKSFWMREFGLNEEEFNNLIVK